MRAITNLLCWLLIIVCLKLVFTAFGIANTGNNNSSIDIAEQSAQIFNIGVGDEPNFRLIGADLLVVFFLLNPIICLTKTFNL